MPMAVNPLSGNQGAAFGCSATTLSLGAARQSVGPFDPIGHSGRTKFAAAATAHPWPEGWHRGIVRPVIHLDRALVPAVLAGHEQAPDAVTAYAAERHRADWFLIPRHMLAN
jgi:hypothetical protein